MGQAGTIASQHMLDAGPHKFTSVACLVNRCHLKPALKCQVERSQDPIYYANSPLDITDVSVEIIYRKTFSIFVNTCQNS